jgi:hypothetical protein
MSGTAIASQKAAWLNGPAAKTRFEARPCIKQRAIIVDIEAYAKRIDAAHTLPWAPQLAVPLASDPTILIAGRAPA